MCARGRSMAKPWEAVNLRKDMYFGNQVSGVSCQPSVLSRQLLEIYRWGEENRSLARRGGLVTTIN